MTTYNVKGKSGQVVIAKDGKDTINIISGNDHVVIAGDGSDTINIKGGNNHLISAGNSTGTSKKMSTDTINILKGKNHTIVGGPKNNVIKMSNSNVQSILGGEGKDIIVIKKGATISNSGYAPTYGNYGIDSAGGNDEITFEKGAGGKAIIFAGKGSDKITIKGGSQHKISAGAGNDTITISAGNSHTIHTDAGTDKVKISAGSGHKVYLDKGTNTVTLNAVSKKSKVTLYGGGASRDNITINWKNGAKKGGIYAISTQSHSRYSYTDTLLIKGIRSSAFQFKNQNGTLVMSNSLGSISVNNMFASLHNTFTGGITFDDRKLSVSALLKKTK